MQFNKRYRKGQQIYNFLAWLWLEGHAQGELKKVNPITSEPEFSLADPFNMSDGKFDKLWEKYSIYLESINETKVR